MVTQTAGGRPLRGVLWLGKRLLLADATFLLVAGGMSFLLELLGHFANIGPFARMFYGSSYTIGFVEAHGLAVLTALLLYRASASNQRHFWHLYAAGVHVLLGSANVLFWGDVLHFGFPLILVVTTIVHGLFVLAQGTCFVLHRQTFAA